MKTFLSPITAYEESMFYRLSLCLAVVAAVTLFVAPMPVSAQTAAPSSAPTAMKTMKKMKKIATASPKPKKKAGTTESKTPGSPNFTGSSPLGSAEKH